MHRFGWGGVAYERAPWLKASAQPPAPCTQVYAPSRTVAVYAPAECADADADAKPAGIPGLGVKGLGPYFSY